MRIRAFLVAVAITAGLTAPHLAVAADKPAKYFAIHAGTFELDPAEIDGTTIYLKLGYQLNKFFGLEAQFGFLTGVKGVPGSDPDGSQAALFARFNLPFEDLNVYALAGVAQLSLNGTDDEFSGTAYGVGIDFYGSPLTALTLEAIQYQDGNATYKSLTLGLKHHFEWPSFR